MREVTSSDFGSVSPRTVRKKADSDSNVESSKTTHFFRILAGLGLLVFVVIIAASIAFMMQAGTDELDLFRRIQLSIIMAFKWVCIPAMYLTMGSLLLFYIASLINEAGDENNTIRRLAAALLPVVTLIFISVMQNDILQYLQVVIEYRLFVSLSMLLVGLLLPEVLRKIDEKDNGAAALMCFILSTIVSILSSILVFIDIHAMHWTTFCFLTGLMVNTAFRPAD